MGGSTYPAQDYPGTFITQGYPGREITLFHCTDLVGASGILNDKSLKASQRGMLGSGIYFAETEPIAAHKAVYASGNMQRFRGVIQCMVQVGKSVVTHRSINQQTKKKIMQQEFQSVKYIRNNDESTVEYVIPEGVPVTITKISIYQDNYWLLPLTVLIFLLVTYLLSLWQFTIALVMIVFMLTGKYETKPYRTKEYWASIGTNRVYWVEVFSCADWDIKVWAPFLGIQHVMYKQQRTNFQIIVTIIILKIK